MLVIELKGQEFFDETTSKFINTPSATLKLEHSLVSLSKWESTWEKPFLGESKTDDETIDYVRCMLLEEVDADLIDQLSSDNISEINDYIASKKSATWFAEDKLPVKPNAPKKKEVITAEIIYFWMLSHNIPFECQYWHINRLLTLIRVCNDKNAPEKKPQKVTGDAIAHRKALNEARKRQQGNSG